MSVPAAPTIEIFVNGKPRTARAGSTVSTLLAELGLREDRVAVELDREIVRRPQWASTRLKDGARLEIVHFVGGGLR